MVRYGKEKETVVIHLWADNELTISVYPIMRWRRIKGEEYAKNEFKENFYSILLMQFL